RRRFLLWGCCCRLGARRVPGGPSREAPLPVQFSSSLCDLESHDQGAGKTTLLRGLINSIPRTERFGTLETDYELMAHLQPGRENVLALQARVGHGERDGADQLGTFSVADLFPEALRQNLTRLIVGEVRGGEAFAMFEAMQA